MLGQQWQQIILGENHACIVTSGRRGWRTFCTSKETLDEIGHRQQEASEEKEI